MLHPWPQYTVNFADLRLLIAAGRSALTKLEAIAPDAPEIALQILALNRIERGGKLDA